MPPAGTGSSGKGLVGKPPGPRYLQALGRSGGRATFSPKEGYARSSLPLSW